MTSIVTKSSTIDDLGVCDPPLVCLFSVQNITKKMKNTSGELVQYIVLIIEVINVEVLF